MTPKPQKLNVLAITRDVSFLRALRVDMPLLNLKRQGLIGDYRVTNPSLFDVPDEFPVDVVWMQRVDSFRLLDHLSRIIGDHYLYDLDDLLVNSVPYEGHELIGREAVLEAVRRCRVLTVTNDRLTQALEKAVGSPLHLKTFVCANGFEFSQQLRVPNRPAGIVLASTEKYAFEVLRSFLINVIAEFAARFDLPVYYFGPPEEAVSYGCPKTISLGLVSFWHFHALLAALPTMIGVAPLEADGGEDLLEFLRCKSDVKMVEYSGFGHASIYSRVPCYVDTDLKAGVLVSNTPEDWATALDAVYNDLWKGLSAEQERTVNLRHMNRIALEKWRPALARCILPETIPAKLIKCSRGRTRFFMDAGRHLIYSQDATVRNAIRRQMPGFLLRWVKRTILD